MADVTAKLNSRQSLEGLGRAVILLGPPGAGKGTQAQRITQWYRVPHLSTGDMLRDNIRRCTQMGQKAKPLMDRGELVPDEIVLGMVEDRIADPDCDHGFLFDGFPRTLPQAAALEEICERRKLCKTIVLHLAVQQELLRRRLLGRTSCKAGGHIYNIYDRPPTRPGICDEDGSGLVHRPDDTEPVITERFAIYESQTVPLVEYYRERSMLNTVDASFDADTVAGKIRKILDERKLANDCL